MKKNTRLIVLCLVSLVVVGCSVCPGQMFIASGVNGNGCCDNETVVVVTKDANGQTTTVSVPSSSATASPVQSVSPSASASPSAAVSPTPSATASPVASVSPSPAPAASTAVAANQS